MLKRFSLNDRNSKVPRRTSDRQPKENNRTVTLEEAVGRGEKTTKLRIEKKSNGGWKGLEGKHDGLKHAVYTTTNANKQI